MNPLYFPGVPKVQPIIRFFKLEPIQYDLSKQTILIAQPITGDYNEKKYIKFVKFHVCKYVVMYLVRKKDINEKFWKKGATAGLSFA